ncbi:hypothetical protein PLESTB_000223900 [Pleodorina starrii]|uniref:Uncharacterized protein n=1 Tax=Pleodorina starrii TaxID=330485 RepID=A0A9W6EY02_9CHLO|nr:hypothetical protein PLESTM_001550000 [Pleodorina starrii]GLC49483.1 hypothetical protein PLESTB_000223900 [Pleodorina starrii]GLC75722.1 hypothetical protein PLESTF_001677500 [Pleodorina starrii]
MAQSSLLILQQSQHAAAPHSKKRGGGLLSRLFNCPTNDSKTAASSSATSRPCAAGASWSSNYATAVSQQATASSTASTSGTLASTSNGQAAGAAECTQAPFLNYKTNLEEKYAFVRELGSGGNGIVRVVVNRETGEEYACKSIRKVLKDASDQKKRGHLDSIRREVAVLTRLRGNLNVVKLEDVYEDEHAVHIIMELCGGGELVHRIGDRHYSERTVASFMRAVLRTLAQCHANNILHRDIKPGNFMLLSTDDRAPVKAIDFGLAAPFDPQQLPRTDLGLEGTPWYMAPETLRGEWSPGSDMWAAGVMAYQLLSGRFPFDDKKNSFAPAITAIWRSVLNDPLDFRHPAWSGVSAEAQDFVRLLLNRDAAARTSAREALRHPWLRGDSAERSVGKKLRRSVVARIQRFASGGLLKRSVLQSIAAELLAHPHMILQQQQEQQQQPSSGGDIDTADAADAADEAGDDDTAGADAAGRDSGLKPAAAAAGMAAGAAAGAVAAVAPEASCLAGLLSQLRLDGADSELDEQQLGEALSRLGFRVAPSEVSRLMEGLDPGRCGSVGRVALAAGLMDWRTLQRNHTELWLQLAEKAFRQLDSDCSGVLEVDELLEALRARLPPEEVRAALEEALRGAAEAEMQPAGAANGDGGGGIAAGLGSGFGAGVGGGGVGLAAGQGIDFEAFVKLLKVGSHDSLDMYDDRMSVRSGGSRGVSLDRYNALLAASSLRRTNAVLATSCSTNATDWSRHGPGGSRHGCGGSRHGGGGALMADASVHSCVSDQSDVSAVQDNDRSQHGVLPPQPLNNRQSAAIAFRFDIDRTDKYGTAGGKAATAAAAGAAATGGSTAAFTASTETVWRFDVGGPKTSALPPPAAATPAWRFDVGGGGVSGGAKRSWDQAAPTEERGRAAAVTAAAAAAVGGGGGGDRSGSGGGHAGRHGGGYFDRRMHGSNLYRNAALKALQSAASGGGGVGAHRGGCLDPVAE